MDYETACKNYSREIEELKILKTRLKKAKMEEFERIIKNIESKNTTIGVFEKWFKFTGNKIPETS